MTAANLFANKDDNHFREALRLYEAKQYKKTVKTLDGILKRNPQHYESFSLKGLALYYSNLPEKGQALEYINKGISKGSTDPVVCHITGLYYRAVKNYKEAAKWYDAAMKNNSSNKGILRDLSSCLTQIRDYKHLVTPRLGYLEDQPAYRANWTAAAVAHYLNGQYKNAENVLTKIEELISDHLADADMFEHSECLLFKNRIIYASGDVERAYDHLLVLEKEGQVGDGLKLQEYKAQYLEELGKPEQASFVYRKLLQRNSDNVSYYYSLERCLGTDKMSVSVRLALYEKLSKFYPRADPPQFIPLLFLKGEMFAKKAEQYILGQLRRGVPATFVNVKPLYKRKSNQEVLYKIVRKFYDGESKENPLTRCWTGYYLAQHYYRLREYSKALEMIEEVICTTPTLVELYIVKARIFKRLNKLELAADTMDKARRLDLQDRFVNCKATKYFLRADKVSKAVDTVSLFTRNEGTPNGVQDLHMMQCVWFLTESAEAYFRLYKLDLKEWQEKYYKEGSEENPDHIYLLARENFRKKLIRTLGLAIKRYRAVIKVFEEYEDDQFDFHHYSMRKGTPRTYLNMLHWEDELYHQPLFLRSAVGITKLYMEVLGHKDLYQKLLCAPDHNLNKTKKEKKDEVKKHEELVEYSRGYAKDQDVFGESTLKAYAGIPEKTKNGTVVDVIDTTAELMKLASRVDKETSVDGLYVVFRVNQYLRKYVLGLQALNRIYSFDRNNHNVGYMYLQLLKDMKGDDTQDAIKRILQIGLKKNFADLLEMDEDESLARKLVENYFQKDNLNTAISVVEAQRVEASKVFEARLMDLKEQLDPYSCGLLEYEQIN
ncbi:hypothetical protein FOA43_001473 [Brettanomyces nanus]|uniref:Tetratricopeptide repeat protein n=1 Tax=Eeniella nana TaxID=13502 RepID=A0A875S2V2_EENNA|nr:uncharacterized protein FOA43_001473 [Brettanomyces nanus]QPG74149.1 hypothetical protein FOA43_001473 [Brettanomyces nanus]